MRQGSSQEGQEEVQVALTEAHSDVGRHTVIFVLPTLDGLQAGPVGGGIRAGEADECVGCKRKANLVLGGWWEDVPAWEVPTSRICPQPQFLFWFYQTAIGLFVFSHPPRPKKKLAK